jgi:hypothetical protein
MTSGTITQADKEFVETWENISTISNGIIRLDVRGDERQELITGRRQFMITSAERIITQDRIVDKKNDPFLNGAFRPIIVPDSVDTTSNPNALGDDDIRRIFKASDLAWGEYMKVIDSPETLRRMVDLADESEDISHRRVRELQRRLAQVKPPTRIVQKDQETYEKMGGQTPPGQGDSRGQQRRGMGGRSSDYRES